jgi:hypothetical protein
MLVPHFMGGLGNMMFQMGATYALAKTTGHDFGIQDIPMPPDKHSKINYKNNIFSQWAKYRTTHNITHIFDEINATPIDIQKLKNINKKEVVQLRGYFQKHYYLDEFKSEVCALFNLPLSDELSSKYSDLSDAYFLQVRRGDYIGNTYHEMDMSNYYKKAIEHIGGGVAYIVTNDISWCKKWDFLKNVPHRIIEDNEVDSLALMMRCGRGGISANSSFGWWGLYLNTNRPHLIIPNRWYPHNMIYQKGYDFKEATVIPV